MAHRSWLISLVIILALASTGGAGNWACFRGPQGKGIADQQNLPLTFDSKEGILWKIPLPGVGNASPIVWENKIFIHAATTNGKERLLLCLDTGDGHTIWSKTLPGATAKIRSDSSLASATPVTDGVMVYVPVWDGKEVHMLAYDFAGNKKWSKNLGHFISQHGPGASPILYKDLVILANDMDKEDKNKNPVDRPSVLVAFHKTTGEIAWETPREAIRACYSAPMILELPGQPDQLIITSTAAVTSYNPEDGKANWEWRWKFKGPPLRTITSPLYLGGKLFVTSGDGSGDRHMAAIDLKGAAKGAQPVTAWENRKDFPYVPSMVNRGDYLYFVNDSALASCFEAKSGKKIWQHRLEGAMRFDASPILVDGNIHAVSAEGEVFVFAANPKFQILGRGSLGETVRATMAVADQRLYIRGDRHLFCIGKK